MSTCAWLDLETLGTQLIMSKISLDIALQAWVQRVASAK
jgi:hypothetical protein